MFEDPDEPTADLVERLLVDELMVSAFCCPEELAELTRRASPDLLAVPALVPVAVDELAMLLILVDDVVLADIDDDGFARAVSSP